MIDSLDNPLADRKQPGVPGSRDTPKSESALSPMPTGGASLHLQHDPVSFWAQCGGGGCSASVEALQLRTKSAVYRLSGAGPNSEPVIAKRCRRRIARLEQFIYEEFLPSVAVSSLHCYGRVEESDTEFDWLFLEDLGDTQYSPLNSAHRVLAGRWLGTIHSAALDDRFVSPLPDRGPRHYHRLLHSTRDLLRQLEFNRPWSGERAAVLRSLARQCDLIEARWSEIEERCAPVPRGLVHGDFAMKNLRVRDNDTSLLAFDWENAGWGAPSGDLAVCEHRDAHPDIAAYCESLHPNGSRISIAALQEQVACGRIFRMLDCVHWAARQKAISHLTVHASRMAEAIRAFNWK